MRMMSTKTRLEKRLKVALLTNQDSAREKRCTVLTSMYVYRKSIEVGQLFSQETALNIHDEGFIIPKTIDIRLLTVKNVKRFLSLVAKIVLFYTKYVVLRQFKPRILELSIKRGH